MNSPELRQLRKRAIHEPRTEGEPQHACEIDLTACATVHFSSEDAAHPVEHMLDGSSGRGANHWASARPDTREEILLEFDEPQHIVRIVYEVEERQVERTQEVRMEFSCDGGVRYSGGFVQEYTFSPTGATYECENLAVDLRNVTHLRLFITPNKHGSGVATLTSLRLFC